MHAFTPFKNKSIWIKKSVMVTETIKHLLVLLNNTTCLNIYTAVAQDGEHVYLCQNTTRIQVFAVFFCRWQ